MTEGWARYHHLLLLLLGAEGFDASEPPAEVRVRVRVRVREVTRV